MMTRQATTFNMARGCKALVSNPSRTYTSYLRGSGFYLSRVSRQIYSETATLAFVGNTFVFEADGADLSVPSKAFESFSGFFKALNHAQCTCGLNFKIT